MWYCDIKTKYNIELLQFLHVVNNINNNSTTSYCRPQKGSRRILRFCCSTFSKSFKTYQKSMAKLFWWKIFCNSLGLITGNALYMFFFNDFILKSISSLSQMPWCAATFLVYLLFVGRLTAIVKIKSTEIIFQIMFLGRLKWSCSCHIKPISKWT